jgi:hypothetical protein
MVVGPLNGDDLRADLEERDDDQIGLGRLLGTLAESVTVEKRDDGDWLRLEKEIRPIRSEGSHDGV